MRTTDQANKKMWYPVEDSVDVNIRMQLWGQLQHQVRAVVAYQLLLLIKKEQVVHKIKDLK